MDEFGSFIVRCINNDLYLRVAIYQLFKLPPTRF